MGLFYKVHTGLVKDIEDKRDFKYSEVMGDAAFDWEKGFNIYESLGIKPEFQDQQSSSSCVSQAVSAYTRTWIYKLTGVDVNFSEKFIYSQIALPGGGAYIRDGVKLVATAGCAKEMAVPSYKNGYTDEAFMKDKSWLNDGILKLALPFDRFNYRVIEGGTFDINVFAKAIRDHNGVIMGHTGSDNGWTRDMVLPPKKNEATWGHCTLGAGAGMYGGKQCIFTPNSWGGRYTIRDGRWKGLQAIPIDYFEASGLSAVAGEYVFPSWVLVPDADVAPDQKKLDFLKKYEGRPISESEESGSFALVKDGKLLVVPKSRVPEFAATVLVKNFGTGISKELWDSLPKSKF